MNELLKGAYDLHVHAAPDVVERVSNDLEIAKSVVAHGMKGYATKAHYFNTVGRAALVNAMVPGCNAIGGVVLNNAVGGINPYAVEMAARAGTKIVWFPTMDAQNMWDFLKKPNTTLPSGCAYDDDSTVKGITILNDGKLIDSVYDVLDLIAQYDLVLATGHISKYESLALLKEAQRRGVKKMIATHSEFPATFATTDEQKGFIECGAVIEHTYLTIINKQFTIEQLKNDIRAVGAENVILSTDLGQDVNPMPPEGFGDYLNALLASGITREEIETMVVKNPTALVE